MDDVPEYAGPDIVPNNNQRSANVGYSLERRDRNILIFVGLLSSLCLLVSVTALISTVIVVTGKANTDLYLNEEERVETSTQTPVKSCAANSAYSPFSNTCFQLSNSRKNWHDAKKFCEENGEHLATFNTLESAFWFLNQRKTQLSWRDFHMWIGGKKNKNGVWEWKGRSTKQIGAVPWGWGEPNNVNGTEDCLSSNYSDDHKFNDILCSHRFQFVCEM